MMCEEAKDVQELEQGETAEPTPEESGDGE